MNYFINPIFFKCFFYDSSTKLPYFYSWSVFFFFSTLWYDGEFIHWKIKHTSWLLVQNLLICPEKTLATRGIDRKLSANGKLIDKCGIYAAHCSDCMTDTRKQCGQATLQGKYNKLMETNVVLCSAVS